MSQALQTRRGTALQLERLQAPREEAGREELKAEFIQLRAKGLSYIKIAKRLKVSKSTLANWSQELEAEIASLKAMELEALQEQYFLHKEGRIKTLGEQYKLLQDELAKRDLKDVATEKLISLSLQTYEQLKEEFVESRPLSDVEIAMLKALG